MADEVTEETPKKKSKLKLLIPIVVVILGLGGAGYMFVLKPKQAAAAAKAAAEPKELELGKIVRLDPITTNLKDKHVLKIGIALQMVAEPEDEELLALVGVKETAGGHEGGATAESATMTLGGLESKALDETIMEMSNFTYEQLSSPDGRAAAKAQLSENIVKIYHGDVHDVYFTDFVMS